MPTTLTLPKTYSGSTNQRTVRLNQPTRQAQKKRRRGNNNAFGLLLLACCANLLGCAQSTTESTALLADKGTVFEGAMVSVSGQRQSPPNIVIFLADDMTWHDVGVYRRLATSLPGAVSTPNIDQLANEGVVFERAFTATAMCSVARHQIYTGLYPVRNGGYGNHSRVYQDTKSIVSYFSEYGYEVALAGKSHVYPRHVFPFKKVGHENKGAAGETTFGLEKTRAFLDDVGERPFVLIVASSNPHIPWNRGKTKSYPLASITVPPYLRDSPRLRAKLSTYLAEVSELDREVGLIDDELGKRGLTDNTIFVFSSEHGSDLPFGKWTAYDAGVKVALVVRWPNKISPGISSAIVESVDLLPTLMDLSINTVPKGLDGRSFAALLKGATDTHKQFALGMQTSKNIHNGVPYPIRWVRTERYKLIENLLPQTRFSSFTTVSKWFQQELADEVTAGTDRYLSYLKRPRLEFYDLERDPFELQNLVGQLNASQTIELERMQTHLYQWMRAQNDQGVQTEMAVCQRKGFSHRGCP